MRELSLNILDIAQNSISAGASLIEITIKEDIDRNLMTISVRDNGCGMDEEQVKSVRDPFYTTRTTRKVGMGIPLFQMEAEMTGGALDIESEKGKGTSVEAVFHTDHLDFIPLGDIVSTFVTLVTMNLDRDFVYSHILNGESFAVDTRVLKDILQGVPLDTPEVQLWIKEYINEQLRLLTEA